MFAQVTNNEFNDAFDWLEEHLEKKIFMFESDDVAAMVEQVVGQ